MVITESRGSKLLIPKSTFAICLADGLTLDQIAKMYTRKEVFPDRPAGSPAFQLDKFIHHLKVKHQMTLSDYCLRYHGFNWPRCPVKGGLVGYRMCGEGLLLSRYNKGAVDPTSEANQAFYHRMSEERKGDGNPMHGKEAWNKGLDLHDPRMEAGAAKRRGKTFGEEVRAKHRAARARSPVKARHTTPHSEAAKEKCRIGTARGWAEGRFNRTSSIHIKMREYLQSLPLKQPFVEEHQVKWFSMDFAFPERKVAIEVQGGYYHVDPRLYPDGPGDAIQRRNWGRDKVKRTICCEREGWVIIEVWETEINSGAFQHDIICKLKQYGLLD